MLFSVGVGRNAPLRYQSSDSGKEIVLGPLKRRLPMRGARRSTLLQMRENDLNYVRIGGIRDHPQCATAQRTDCASRSKGLGIDM
jgi:hypothetical protein